MLSGSRTDIRNKQGKRIARVAADGTVELRSASLSRAAIQRIGAAGAPRKR
jgi:hypothetical protein